MYWSAVRWNVVALACGVYISVTDGWMPAVFLAGVSCSQLVWLALLGERRANLLRQLE